MIVLKILGVIIMATIISLLITPILAFLASVVNIWNFPHGEQIIATLTALDTLIGGFVVVMNKLYKDGRV